MKQSKSIKSQVLAKQVEQTKDIELTPHQVKLPGETFEAYLKRQSLIRKGKG